MRGQKNDIIDLESQDKPDCHDISDEPSPGTKLERRRRIEDLLERKRLQEEMGEFDFL